MDTFKISANDFVTEKNCRLSDAYEIKQVLGEGSYGAVRKITHRITKEDRAVKILLKNKLSSPDAIQKISNELKILQMLDHPNILKVYESYQDKFSYCIVTELCTGGELFECLSKSNGLPEEEAAEYIRHILSCVAYLHEKKIVHRDLKPENFLMHSHSGFHVLKLIDFGAACVFEPKELLTERVGTSYYIAPEVLKGRYSEKCDLWSAGVILHILLIGSVPFDGKNDSQIMQKIQNTKIDPKHAKYQMVSPQARDLLFKLLEYNPDKRLSAKDSLSHDWLRRLSSRQINQADSMPLLENLQSFHPHKKIEKLTLSFITNHLLENHEIERVTQLFDSWDTDQSGTLSFQEFRNGITNFLRLADSDVLALFQDIDSDNSGEIDFSEFVTACCVKEGIFNRQVLGLVFQEYDYDRSGKVNKEKLKHIVGGKKSMDDRVWDEMIEEIDDRGNGSFDFDQFLRAFSEVI